MQTRAACISKSIPERTRITTSTGLIRLHKAGEEPLLGPSDGTSIKNGALALGVAWPEGTNWQSLAALDHKQIKNIRLSVQNPTPQEVRFTLRYELNRPSVKAVTETYRLTPLELQMETKIEGDVDKIRLRLPVLAFDGQRASRITTERSEAKVQFGKSTQICLITNPPGQHWKRTGSWLESRNGYLEPVEAEVNGNHVALILYFAN